MLDGKGKTRGLLILIKLRVFIIWGITLDLWIDGGMFHMVKIPKKKNKLEGQKSKGFDALLDVKQLIFIRHCAIWEKSPFKTSIKIYRT